MFRIACAGGRLLEDELLAAWPVAVFLLQKLINVIITLNI
jgi:hypothetical protein